MKRSKAGRSRIFKNSDGELWCECGNRVHTYGFFHFHESPEEAAATDCDGFCDYPFWRCDACGATVDLTRAPIKNEPEEEA